MYTVNSLVSIVSTILEFHFFKSLTKFVKSSDLTSLTSNSTGEFKSPCPDTGVTMLVSIILAITSGITSFFLKSCTVTSKLSLRLLPSVVVAVITTLPSPFAVILAVFPFASRFNILVSLTDHFISFISASLLTAAFISLEAPKYKLLNLLLIFISLASVTPLTTVTVIVLVAVAPFLSFTL